MKKVNIRNNNSNRELQFKQYKGRSKKELINLK